MDDVHEVVFCAVSFGRGFEGGSGVLSSRRFYAPRIEYTAVIDHAASPAPRTFRFRYLEPSRWYAESDARLPMDKFGDFGSSPAILFCMSVSCYVCNMQLPLIRDGHIAM